MVRGHRSPLYSHNSELTRASPHKFVEVRALFVGGCVGTCSAYAPIANYDTDAVSQEYVYLEVLCHKARAAIVTMNVVSHRPRPSHAPRIKHQKAMGVKRLFVSSATPTLP